MFRKEKELKHSTIRILSMKISMPPLRCTTSKSSALFLAALSMPEHYRCLLECMRRIKELKELEQPKVCPRYCFQ